MGQQVLLTVPEIPDGKNQQLIVDILSRLADVHFNLEEWQFTYSDKIFSSQNYKFSAMNANSRGGIMDFVVSVILTPTSDKVMQKTYEIWDYVPTIRDICLPLLFEFDSENIQPIVNLLTPWLNEIIDEIDNILV